MLEARLGGVEAGHQRDREPEHEAAEPRIAEIATALRGTTKQSSPTATGSHSITWITRGLPHHELTIRK